MQRTARYYDTGDPTKPLDAKWFQLESLTQGWTSDMATTSPNKKRCYQVEHVLEWQLLTKFIEEDKDKDDTSRCAHLYKYFLKDLPTFDYKIKVAKDDGKLDSNDHFEYEEKEYEFSKWDVKAQTKPRMIDWIST
jgi:hypothetical protein